VTDFFHTCCREVEFPFAGLLRRLLPFAALRQHRMCGVTESWPGKWCLTENIRTGTGPMMMSLMSLILASVFHHRWYYSSVRI